MTVNTYSFADVQASITGQGGSFPLGSGVGAAEEGIEITKSNPKNTMVTGADGTPQHSLRASNSGRVTIRLLKTSPVNAQLMTMYRYQKGSSALWGQNTITISNAVSGDSFVNQQCAFDGIPDITYAAEANNVEWSFDCGIIDPNLGDGAPATATS